MFNSACSDAQFLLKINRHSSLHGCKEKWKGLFTSFVSSNKKSTRGSKLKILWKQNELCKIKTYLKTLLLLLIREFVAGQRGMCRIHKGPITCISTPERAHRRGEAAAFPRGRGTKQESAVLWYNEMVSFYEPERASLAVAVPNPSNGGPLAVKGACQHLMTGWAWKMVL